jgi:pre-mRNA-processing factor 8
VGGKARKDGKLRFDCSGSPMFISPDHCRKLMRDVSKSLSGNLVINSRAKMGALKYIPHSIFKVVENLNNPWEVSRYAQVLYHISGALTYVYEVP